MSATLRFVGRGIRRVGLLLQRLGSRIIPPTQHEAEVARWHAVDGDATLRLDYSLDARSVVIDLGGYRGQWASDVYARYRSRVMVFEPVLAFAAAIEARFAANPDISVHPFGLGAIDESVGLSVAGDRSTTFGAGLESSLGVIRCADAFLREQGIERVDLMKVNIEGGEYALLDHLIETDRISDVVDLQVQFHDFVPDAVARRAKIRAALSSTHVLTYDYPFVWESWRRR